MYFYMFSKDNSQRDFYSHYHAEHNEDVPQGNKDPEVSQTK